MTVKKKKELALLLYQSNSFTVGNIAEKLDVGEAIINKWIAKEAWGKKKSKYISSRDEQLLAFYEQLTNLNNKIKNGDGYPTEKEAMTQRRLSAAIAYLETQCHVGMVIKVAKEFSDWISTEEQDRDHIVFRLIDSFVRERIEAAGALPYLS